MSGDQYTIIVWQCLLIGTPEESLQLPPEHPGGLSADLKASGRVIVHAFVYLQTQQIFFHSIHTWKVSVPYVCRISCFRKLLELVKPFPHWEQMTFFCLTVCVLHGASSAVTGCQKLFSQCVYLLRFPPVWLLSGTVRALLKAKLFVQYLHRNGFSPCVGLSTHVWSDLLDCCSNSRSAYIQSVWFCHFIPRQSLHFCHQWLQWILAAKASWFI